MEIEVVLPTDKTDFKGLFEALRALASILAPHEVFHLGHQTKIEAEVSSSACVMCAWAHRASTGDDHLDDEKQASNPTVRHSRCPRGQLR